MSEIDDIFACKGKSKVPHLASLSSPTKSKKEKKNRLIDSSSLEHRSQQQPSNKRPAPDTVLDPSTHLTKIKRRKKELISEPVIKLKSKVDSKKPLDVEKFKDSRGPGSRRKTDEGWSIYKEEELGMGNEGGDTPLCPFDCDCCF